VSLNISVNLSTDEVGAEVEVTLDAYLVMRIAEQIDAIDKRFGPNRDIGPVRFIVRDRQTLITIGTQKQGDQEYHLGKYGQFKEGHPS
jgi:hypothetical protein